MKEGGLSYRRLLFFICVLLFLTQACGANIFRGPAALSHHLILTGALNAVQG